MALVASEIAYFIKDYFKGFFQERIKILDFITKVTSQFLKSTMKTTKILLTFLILFWIVNPSQGFLAFHSRPRTQDPEVITTKKPIKVCPWNPILRCNISRFFWSQFEKNVQYNDLNKKRSKISPQV